MQKDFKTCMEDGVLRVWLCDGIDANDAHVLDKKMKEILTDDGVKSVCFDCRDLKSISSAGLRVILHTVKALPATKVVEVPPEIYSVFEMTGFTEIMEVRKVYRVISVEGLSLIGSGANGRVFRIDDDTIVKTYLREDALEEINRERLMARTAFVLGIPTALSYDVVRIREGGFGAVYEMLDALSYGELLQRGEKSVDEIADMSVKMLRLIHSREMGNAKLPSIREMVLGWTRDLRTHLPEDQIDRFEKLVEGVPDENTVLHGDFHVKNVMFQDGESLMIDMDTLCHGHPVFELAGVRNTIVTFGEADPDPVNRFLGLSFETTRQLWDRILQGYLSGMTEEALRDVDRKARLIGMVRILRRMIRHGEIQTGEGQRKEAYFRQKIGELLEQVHDLSF